MPFLLALMLFGTEALALSWTVETGGRGYGAPVPSLSETEGARVTLWSPDPRPIPLDGRRPQLPATATGYYQALVARRQTAAGEESAIHYLRLRSRSRPDLRGQLSVRPENRQSPADVVARKKATLEIVPDPLPREHNEYHEDMEARFQLRFQGAPIAERPVILRTENGSQYTRRTDESGLVDFTIPRDLESAESASMLQLRAAHRADGRRYRTSLAVPYGPDPDRWQSLVWAGGLLAAGLFTGGILARRVTAITGRRGRAKKS